MTRAENPVQSKFTPRVSKTLYSAISLDVGLKPCKEETPSKRLGGGNSSMRRLLCSGGTIRAAAGNPTMNGERRHHFSQKLPKNNKKKRIDMPQKNNLPRPQATNHTTTLHENKNNPKPAQSAKNKTRSHSTRKPKARMIRVKQTQARGHSNKRKLFSRPARGPGPAQALNVLCGLT